MGKINFTKMHGSGNDYIYVYTPSCPIEHPSTMAMKWSQVHTGIGSDGLILIGTSLVADFSMRIFNNDGSEALMCGNGIRCVGKYVYDHHMTDKTTLTIETLAGIKTLQLFTDAQNNVTHVKVNMGIPVFTDKQLFNTPSGNMQMGTIQADGKTYTGTFVSMGNPHFVIFVDDINTIHLSIEGSAIEQLPLFPQGCNIEFSQILPDGSLRTRVWERGSGITLACGTGACATAVAAQLCDKKSTPSKITMDGGELQIEWNGPGTSVYMTGPAETVFEGSIV